jgi:hypothetical protein
MLKNSKNFFLRNSNISAYNEKCFFLIWGMLLALDWIRPFFQRSDPVKMNRVLSDEVYLN